MRRQLNLRLFLWLVAWFVAGGLVLHIVHTVQAARHADALLRRAQAALSKNDLAHAVTYFSHYLAYEPGDTDALAQFGLAQEKCAHTGAGRLQAMLTMEEVLRREPQRADVRFRLVHCLIALGKDWLPDAVRHLQILLREWPEAAEVEHLLGWCHEAKEEYAKAADWFRQSVAHDPRRIPTYVLLAQTLQGKLGQKTEALAVLDRMVAGNPGSFQAYLARARFHKEHGALTKGDADIRRAVELAPSDEEVLLASAEWAQGHGRIGEAHKTLTQGLTLYPESEPMYRSLAQVELLQGRRGDAIACLRKGLDVLSRSTELLALLADLLIDEGRLSDATDLYRRLRQDDPAEPLGDYLEARLAIIGGNWPDAVPLLERASAELPESSSFRCRVEAALGFCHEQSGDLDRQLAAYERAVALAPAWLEARFGLAASLYAARRFEEALPQLRQVLQARDVPPGARPLLVRTLVQRTLGLPPRERDWTAVAEALAAAVRAAPKAAETIVLQAEVLVARQDYAAATKLLQGACARAPKEPSLWIALAGLETQQQHWERAEQVFASAAKAVGDVLELRLAHIAAAGIRGGEQVRPVLLQLGKATGSFKPAQLTRLYRALTDAWYRLGDLEAAESYCRELARRDTHDMLCRLDLFEINLQRRRETEARAVAGEISRLDGEHGTLAAYTQAALDLETAGRGDLAKAAEADRLLADVARRRHTWARVPLLQARSAELQGQTDRAIDYYLRAWNLGETRPDLVRRLAHLLVSRRRYTEADQVLQRAASQTPLGKDGERLAAEVALAARDLPRALALVDRAAPAETRDYRDLLWSARLARLAGDNTRAEKTLRRGVLLAGHTPDTWIALVRELVQTDQRRAAVAVIENMRRTLPHDRVDLSLARAHEALGECHNAASLFVKLAREHPDDIAVLYHAAAFYLHADLPEKAEPLLRRLLAPAVAAPAEEASWARRALAVLLAQTGRQEEGLALLPGSKSGRNTAADDRARAVVWAATKSKVRGAVTLFERTLPRRPLDADEHFALVQLYDAAGEPAKARDWLQDLLAAHPDNPQFLAYFIRRLISQGQTADALSHLPRLERLEPDSPRTRELRRKLASKSV